MYLLEELIEDISDKSIERQLDIIEEARILDSVGLDLDLEPVNPQTPDWIRMCSIMNGEEIEEEV